MVNYPPDYCPYCGAELSAVDPPSVHHCEACEEYVFHNPTPTARVAVLDGDAVLLVRPVGADRPLWGTPGGAVEADEDPDVAGARELEEELGVSVDPADLVLFDARTFAKFGAVQKTSICYAVEAAAVDGTPRPRGEVTAVRYWTPAELDAAEDRLLTSWPEAHKNLQWWVDNGRAALDES